MKETKLPRSMVINQPLHNIYIIAIGGPGAGKTSFLSFLAEALFDEGIDCSDARSERKGTVVLVDELTEDEYRNLHKTQAKDKYISVRVTRKTYPIHWSDNVSTDLFIGNDGMLRLFDCQTKDLFKSEIQRHKVWTEAFKDKP